MSWQPIETAPKNLTSVLVYSESWGVCEAQYECYASEPFWSIDVHDFVDLSEGVYELEDIRVVPTYWQPLPAPPEQLEQV